MKRLFAVLLSAALCASLVSCGSGAALADEPSSKTPSAGEYSLHSAKDYDEILSLLRSEEKNQGYTGGEATNWGMLRNGVFSGVSTAASADTAEAPAQASGAQAENKAAAEPESGDAGTEDYSGTNVQVAGIDEGDIVKTDGKYLYVMDSGGAVRIVKADGANTAVVGKISARDGRWANELFVDGDTLVILCTSSNYDETVQTKDGTRTVAEFYDISDKTAPVRKTELGQDGGYSTARLMDGKLYVVSSMSVWYWGVSGTKPEARQYAPCVYDGGKETVMPSDCILLPPEVRGDNYTVLTSADLSGGARISEQAVLGSSATVYMNDKNLYLASSDYSETAGEPYTKDQYAVTDYTGGSTTALTRFSLDGGKLAMAASGSIPGSLVNQFAMDEKDGYLRVVTTIDQYSWSIYSDGKYGFENYREGDSLSSSALYVLGSDLRTAGSVQNLAPGERVYSVRFDGDTGYFVTYKQVDPLFAVDLKDPKNPKVLSALKIPGFSQYLHVWGDGMLFGLGENTRGEDGTIPDGLKLSMFNVSDPANVTEITTLGLDGSWSAAQYNHKAILVLPDRNIIAFPMDQSYVVYGYENGAFSKRAEMDMGGLWADGVRGVRIGELFYVCAQNGVGVYSLGDFSRVASVAF